jgi:hypothetical protein
MDRESSGFQKDKLHFFRDMRATKRIDASQFQFMYLCKHSIAVLCQSFLSPTLKAWSDLLLQKALSDLQEEPLS